MCDCHLIEFANDIFIRRWWIKKWRGSDKHPEILKLLIALLNMLSVFFFSLEVNNFPDAFWVWKFLFTETTFLELEEDRII